MQQTLINLFAGPCKGKSTVAAGLFHLMKTRGHAIEYVPEYAKDLAWEGRVTRATQIDLVMNQYLRLERLCRRKSLPTAEAEAKPDYIVTDCPLLLGLVYGKTSPGYLPPSWPQFLKELHFSFASVVNVFLTGGVPYSEHGRAHNEDAANILHESIRQMLAREGIHAYYLNNAEDTPEAIYSILKHTYMSDTQSDTQTDTQWYLKEPVGNDGYREAQGR